MSVRKTMGREQKDTRQCDDGDVLNGTAPFVTSNLNEKTTAN